MQSTLYVLQQGLWKACRRPPICGGGWTEVSGTDLGPGQTGQAISAPLCPRDWAPFPRPSGASCSPGAVLLTEPNCAGWSRVYLHTCQLLAGAGFAASECESLFFFQRGTSWTPA